MALDLLFGVSAFSSVAFMSVPITGGYGSIRYEYGRLINYGWFAVADILSKIFLVL